MNGQEYSSFPQIYFRIFLIYIHGGDYDKIFLFLLGTNWIQCKEHFCAISSTLHLSFCQKFAIFPKQKNKLPKSTNELQRLWPLREQQNRPKH
jgi:hypothetical protein